jgi:hypothetical protein
LVEARQCWNKHQKKCQLFTRIVIFYRFVIYFFYMACNELSKLNLGDFI